MRIVSLFVFLFAATALAQPIPVILDTDLGDDIDDTWALAQLLGTPALDVKLIVTASDNTPVKTRLVAKMLEAWGRTDIPLGTGKATSENPINQAAWLGDYAMEGYPGTVHEDGVQALINVINASPVPVTLCIIGPQTNIGEALKRDPGIAGKARVVSMAGSVHIGYNGSPTPQREWNVFRDVAAIQAVFAAPWEITIAPLDSCGTLALSGARYAAVRQSGHPLARVTLENYALWSNRKNYAADVTSILFDTLAIYLAHSEDWVNVETVNLSIDAEGNTNVDPAGRPVRCALSWKDRAAYEDHFVNALTAPAGVSFSPTLAYRDFPPVDALPVLDDLPNPYAMFDGTPVGAAANWPARRAELLAMVEHYQFGHQPPAPGNVAATLISETPVWEGAGVLERHRLTMGPENRVSMEIGFYRPADTTQKRGVLMAIEPVWDPEFLDVARQAVERGYIFAGYNQHDLDADNADRSDGVHAVYPDYDWATISAWAWGASRLMDYLQTRPDVDPAKFTLTGHSRRGKTALWAAALDERIRVVAPHGSGEGGTGSHRIQGDKAESLEMITRMDRFHYWFHPRLRTFAGKENQLPFDQHLVRALIAPRAVVSLDGLEDHWANPLGTQQMWRAAQAVFAYLGVPNNNRIYFRDGGHDWTPEDWKAYIDYCAHFFESSPVPVLDGKLPFPDAPAPMAWGTPGQ
jgi:inosine-uridine nucleoside N-ribohydrolase/dienelactone hydrolase